MTSTVPVINAENFVCCRRVSSGYSRLGFSLGTQGLRSGFHLLGLGTEVSLFSAVEIQYGGH